MINCVRIIQKSYFILFFIFLFFSSTGFAQVKFSSRESRISVNGGSLFIQNPYNQWTGTLEEKSGVLAGSSIGFDYGVYRKDNKKAEINGLMSGSGTDFVLQGNNSIFANPGTLLSPILVLGSGNVLEGAPDFVGTTTLLNSFSELQVNITNRLGQSILMNNGLITLLNDLTLGDNTVFTGSGRVNLNYRTLRLPAKETTWTSKLYFTTPNDIILSSKTSLSGTWTFDGANAVLNGNGNILDLTSGGSLWIKSGTDIEFTDVHIRGLGEIYGSIIFEDATSRIRLSNATLQFASNYSVTQGGIYVEGANSLIITGTNVLTIATGASMTVDRVTLFADALAATATVNIVPSIPDNIKLVYLNNGIIKANGDAGLLAIANSNAIVGWVKDTSNAMAGLVVAMSDAIVAGGGNALAVDNSNAIIGWIKDTSNNLVSTYNLVIQNSYGVVFANSLAVFNSNAIKALSRGITNNSNAIVGWIKNTSDVMVSTYNLVKQNSYAIINNSNRITVNSNAILSLSQGITDNSNAIIGWIQDTSNNLVSTYNLVVENSWAILNLGNQVTANSDAILSLSQGITDNSNAIVGWVQDTSNNLVSMYNLVVENSYGVVFANSLAVFNSNAIKALSRGITNNSNAIVGWIRNTSNVMVSTYNLVKQNSYAILNLGNRVTANSDAIIGWIQDTSNNLVSTYNLVVENSSAILNLGNQVTANSDAIVSWIQDTSNNLVSTYNFVIENSWAILSLGNRVTANSDAILSLSQGITDNSNAIVGWVQDTSNNLGNTYGLVVNNSWAILNLENQVTANSNAIVTTNNLAIATSNGLIALSNAIMVSNSLAIDNSNAIVGWIKDTSNNLVSTYNLVVENSWAILGLTQAVSTNSWAILALNDQVGANSWAILNLDAQLEAHSNAIVTLDQKVADHNAAILGWIQDTSNAAAGLLVDTSYAVIAVLDRVISPTTRYLLENKPTASVIMDDSLYLDPGDRISIYGDLTIDGSGATIFFCDPFRSQLAVLPGNNVRLRNVTLANLNQNSIHIPITSQLIIEDNVFFYLSHDMTFSLGSIILGAEAANFFVHGYGGTKKLSFSKHPALLTPGLQLGSSSLVLQDIELDGVESIEKTATFIDGQLIEGGIVCAGNAAINFYSSSTMNFLIEYLNNTFCMRGNSIALRGSISYGSKLLNELFIQFSLQTVSADPYRILFGDNSLYLASSVGRAYLTFTDFLVQVFNEGSNSFLMDEHSGLFGRNLFIQNFPIKLLSTQFEIDDSLILSSDQENAIDISFIRSVEQLKRYIMRPMLAYELKQNQLFDF